MQENLGLTNIVLLFFVVSCVCGMLKISVKTLEKSSIFIEHVLE